ncbi:hypothetical protein BDV25DRAFT_62317 [Aspergillus avenaceus]|uniref:Transmembrane protein n=1 Tax=Aspergillus avenaceus TaxID=36643 RepID=A0A5N6THG5_ASPAV|nr:hypothetical protein BDV25DRAFT_62317 [Aspergillus avenaceus]
MHYTVRYPGKKKKKKKKRAAVLTGFGNGWVHFWSSTTVPLVLGLLACGFLSLYLLFELNLFTFSFQLVIFLIYCFITIYLCVCVCVIL